MEAGDEDGGRVAVSENLGHNLGDGGGVGEVGCVGPDLAAELLDGFLCGCGCEIALSSMNISKSAIKERTGPVLCERDTIVRYSAAEMPSRVASGRLYFLISARIED